MIPTSEKKAKGSFDSTYDWASVWAGVDEGDTIYHGNYKLYLKKSGSKSITYTGIILKDYTYNASRKMIYSIPSKHKGQPDLFIVAETESSNFEYAIIHFVYNGKLKKAKRGFEYSLRPQNIGKNSFRTPGYNNADGKWLSFVDRQAICEDKVYYSSSKLHFPKCPDYLTCSQTNVFF